MDGPRDEIFNSEIIEKFSCHYHHQLVPMYLLSTSDHNKYNIFEELVKVVFQAEILVKIFVKVFYNWLILTWDGGKLPGEIRTAMPDKNE